jgi:hypothetical protein
MHCFAGVRRAEVSERAEEQSDPFRSQTRQYPLPPGKKNPSLLALLIQKYKY